MRSFRRALFDDDARRRRARYPREGKERDMKVGILGSSDVAKSLARGFLNEVHEVMLGSREPGKLASWVRESCKDFGWNSIDVGGIGLSHYLEATAMVWIITAFAGGHWSHAFKLLRN